MSPRRRGTDKIDARMLAAMGQALQLPAESAPDDSRAALASLHKRRDQLVGMRAAERVWRSEFPGQEDSLQSHIAWLDAEIARL